MAVYGGEMFDFSCGRSHPQCSGLGANEGEMLWSHTSGLAAFGAEKEVGMRTGVVDRAAVYREHRAKSQN